MSTNSTVNHAISINTQLDIQGVPCNVIVQGDNADEIHTHLAGLLGNVEAPKQGGSQKAAGKSSGKTSAKKKAADTAEESTTTDAADAAEPAKGAKQEEQENPTKADPEPTQTAQHTPAETGTAPEATATSSASTTAEPSIEPKDVLTKAKELLGEKGGEAKLQAILKEHGANRVSTVPADKLQAVYGDLAAALGEDDGGLL